MKRDFRIEIKSQSLDELGAEFKQVWENAEKGNIPAKPIERVSFDNLRALVQVLTPKRIGALTVLHESGPLSIRALARLLRRDFKNVHQDVQILQRIGLVEETANGLYAAPFEKIIAEIALAA